MTRVSTWPFPSQTVDGLQIPAIFSAEAFRSAVRYQPQSDDLFLVTYPKCGTTWTQHIILLIFRRGEPFKSHTSSHMYLFLEAAGAEAAKRMPRPGLLKIHLPFHLTPWSDKAKYIYVTRNPKDCCLSYFHHLKDMPHRGYKGTFDRIFECFISGCVDYGDYFDHLLGWHEHKNDPNVLFITYEEMKEDPKAAILKIASFIDDKSYGELLRNNEEMLNNIIKYSSFNYMKESVNKGLDELFSMSKEDILNSELAVSMKKMILSIKEETGVEEKPVRTNFVRKGIVGDWKNYFSEEQSKRMDEKFAKRTRGTDIPDLWKKYM